jgi:hypothetical protein
MSAATGTRADAQTLAMLDILASCFAVIGLVTSLFSGESVVIAVGGACFAITIGIMLLQVITLLPLSSS